MQYKQIKISALSGILFFCISLIGFSLNNENITESSIINHYKSVSVLASGYWVKIKVLKSGIYKITYKELTDMGLSNPSHPRIFGNGGWMLPEANYAPHPDDLEEIPIWMNKGSDNAFNQNDYLLFYAKGPEKRYYATQDSMYRHQLNLYDAGAYYFITSGGTGKTIMTEKYIDSVPDYVTSAFDAFQWHEIDKENLIQSGREWYEPISTQSSSTFDFSFPGRIQEEAVRIRIRVVGRSSATSYFNIEAGGIQLAPISVAAVNLNSFTTAFARAGTKDYKMIPQTGDDIPVIISFNSADQVNSRAWLDYIDIQTRCRLILSGKELFFRDIHSVAPGNISEFILETTKLNVRVWDITDLNNVREIETKFSGNKITFRVSTDTLKEFIAFSGKDFPSPEVIEKNLPNQNLHGLPQAEMIIVTHPNFLEEAYRLANLHQTKDQMTVTVVTTSQVYNEFSSGSRDIAAIRNFMKMFYDRAQTPEEKPRYLLLFGDGSYANKSMDKGNTNFIPTYQSPNSLAPTQSFVSDDFFGILDNHEGGVSGLVDIGIGRFPVSTPEDAKIIVNKIESYQSSKATGDWRNNICFVGDDEDNNIHLIDADKLASYVETHYPSFVIEKVYLDAYPQASTANGARYPEVNKTINDKIEKGLLIFNYVGHGNERGLAHENILTTNDINSWTNVPRYPLFITATCEFSRFDYVDINNVNGAITPKPSAGEMVILNPVGGGIALLTTTRLVYSSPNFVLNQNFYKYIFSKNDIGKPNTLGDALRYTKNASGSLINKRNFTLLGDPALRLAYPEYKVITDSINKVPVTLPFDTLKALKKITISGHVENEDGVFLPDVKGIIYPSVFDKARIVTTLGNDSPNTMTFLLQDNILFKGQAEINNGIFNFSFLVPKDISYNPGKGKLSYYATLDNGKDAAGTFEKILVGGFTKDPEMDVTGPEIRLYLNDTLFRNGGLSDENPVFLAYVKDKGGINTVGNGIGHDIIAILDDEETNPIILNNYFTYEMNSYQKGVVSYPFFHLSQREHTIFFKVWDNYNNSSEATLSFHVNDQPTNIMENVRNYPNPFREDTWFTLEHNLSDQELDIQVRIYNLSGGLIRIINEHQWVSGYTIDPIHWDGKDSSGEKVAAGIYVFQIILRSKEGSLISGNGKLFIIH
ncbi:MAG TPA: type IX secretion system sortase PorU [Bacteroidetes bacterium]|nr:type IX secretion system sortase PorU [Bacteroidota bacterium]